MIGIHKGAAIAKQILIKLTPIQSIGKRKIIKIVPRKPLNK
jgi:hypothetical protein